MGTELMNGIFIDKNNLLEDLSKTYKGGLFTDTTFTMSDGVEISTNKFMLWCRSPFFDTMFSVDLRRV